MTTRCKLHIKGIVQGVGFRPFIYNLATSFGLKGWVLNSTDGVHIEVEGREKDITEFIQQIEPQAPPLARIDSLSSEQNLSPKEYKEFKIQHSSGDASKYVKISPDVCTCRDCLIELFDENDRRYRYPFINCTNCGPRFTIIEDIPYDREKTTMRVFPMCPDCQSEYEDVTNRRFHAQPNACPVCGPSVWLEDSNGSIIEKEGAINRAIELLKEGKIVGVKGLGGFHLACDATNEDAVSLLRKRKRRVMKPFAIMSTSIDKVKSFCSVNEHEQKLLESIQRPIVLLNQLSDCAIADSVAPYNNFLGVMLPYTPLHYLLLDDKQILALVMTSGNISEEPIVIDNDEAKERLAGLADYFLMHNRDICARCDDSVALVELDTEIMARRSRGYAPYPIDLDFEMPQILGCGAELKNTFCLTKENHAFLSQHIGDLQNVKAYGYYELSIDYFKRLFRIEPEIVAYDLHPDYFSTRYALNYGKETIGIQHHHAHIVSCMAENGLKDKVIGVALDGTGYGTDGKIWGGEFFLADCANFIRFGHIKYIPLPGGDAATKEVDRMALSYLYEVFGEELWRLKIPFVSKLERNRAEIILKMIKQNINSPMTSSCGRLFDAVSALIGVRQKTSYEAQAAIELEMQAHKQNSVNNDFYGFKILENEGNCIIDLSLMFREIVDDINRDIDKTAISGKFHNTVAQFTLNMCQKIKNKYDTDKVVLSGGVFQNRYLLRKIVTMLRAHEFVPYFQRKVPTNDGGISLGQVVIAYKKLNG